MLFTSPASATDIRQIEQICDRFEAAWQNGQRPRPESYLAQAARPLHATLLRHLVTLDWEYRLKAGEQPLAAEYQKRFPLISSEIEAIAREVATANESSGAHPLRLGKYRIVRQVGRGGMGVVYEAIEEPVGRRRHQIDTGNRFVGSQFPRTILARGAHDRSTQPCEHRTDFRGR